MSEFTDYEIIVMIELAIVIGMLYLNARILLELLNKKGR
jgi:hypothetical protein